MVLATAQLEKSKIRSETEILASVVPLYPTLFLQGIAQGHRHPSSLLGARPGYHRTEITCLLSLSWK